MPRFRNIKADKTYVEFHGQRIEANSYLEDLPQWDAIADQVDIAAAAPYFNPILNSQKVTQAGDTTITVATAIHGNQKPSWLNIVLRCTAGSATVYFNSKDNTPALALEANDVFVLKCAASWVKTIIVNIASSATVKVDVLDSGTSLPLI